MSLSLSESCFFFLSLFQEVVVFFCLCHFFFSLLVSVFSLFVSAIFVLSLSVAFFFSLLGFFFFSRCQLVFSLSLSLCHYGILSISLSLTISFFLCPNRVFVLLSWSVGFYLFHNWLCFSFHHKFCFPSSLFFSSFHRWFFFFCSSLVFSSFHRLFFGFF